MNNKKLLLFTILILLTTAIYSTEWKNTKFKLIANEQLLGSLYEPSGILWHSTFEKLYIVSDHGALSELTKDGLFSQSWILAGDLEALTYNPNTPDLIYIGIEDPDQIMEWDIHSHSWTGKSWNLEAWLKGPPNAGLEALAFVPNGFHPYANTTSGGLFYVGLQNDGLIYVFDIHLKQPGSAILIDTLSPTHLSDISGLYFDSNDSSLYAIYDSANLLVQIDLYGHLIRSFHLPGNDQEGITMIPNCKHHVADIFIAEDKGPEIWKYTNFPISCSQKIKTFNHNIKQE